MEWMASMTERTQRRLFFAASAVVGVAIIALIIFRPGEQASAGVDLNDPHAWMEHGLDGQLLQINGATGEVTARIAVSEPGDMIRAVPHGDGAVVLNQTNGTLSQIGAELIEHPGERRARRKDCQRRNILSRNHVVKDIGPFDGIQEWGG